MSMSPGDEDYVAGAFEDWEDAIRDFFVSSPQMLDDAWAAAGDHAQTLRDGLAASLDTLGRLATAPTTVGDTLEVWNSARDELNTLEANCTVERFPASGDDAWKGQAATEYRSVLKEHKDALEKLALAVAGIAAALAAVKAAKDKKSGDLASARNTGTSGVLASAAGGPWALLVGGVASVGYVAFEVDAIEETFDASVRDQVRELKTALTHLPGRWPGFDGSLDGK